LGSIAVKAATRVHGMQLVWGTRGERERVVHASVEPDEVTSLLTALSPVIFCLGNRGNAQKQEKERVRGKQTK